LMDSKLKQSRKYLDPIMLSKLSNMDLVARCVMEGMFTGMHPSPFHGFSVEYSEHRDYQPGDELKYVDWKMFGRSDKLYIKQFHQETNLTVYIMVDSSKSMAFASENSVSKFDYASFLASALSYLMLGQSDSVGLVTFSDKIDNMIPPRSRRTHLNQILSALEHNKPAGQTRLAEVIHTVANMTTRRGLVILISDMLDDIDDVYKGLAHLKYLNHDVLLLHTMDHQELYLEYEGLVQFEDMESKKTLRTFPQSVAKSYRQRVESFVHDVETTARKSGIDYCLLDTSLPLNKALISYLAKRKRMM
jgi:uncharacterized protein (DUF58 family)